MREKMKAVQIHAPGRYSVDLVDIPEPLRNEVLVEIKSVAICGSDPGIFDGKVLQNGWPPYYPFIAGHEFAGQVVALGEGVTKLSVGDRVSGEAHCGCGICASCMGGFYNLCLNYGRAGSGHHHYGHNTPGCYAQFQVYDQKALTIMPDNVSYDEGTLVDTAGTAFNALRLTGVVPGGDTAIIGSGPMGMFAMLIAKALGSRTIMIGSGQRLDMAKALGADETINYRQSEDIVSAVKELTKGYGAHQVIEAAGNSSAYYQSVQMARKGGQVALISIPPQDGQEAALKSLIMNQITFHGVRANPNCSQPVLQLMSSGQIAARALITHIFPMDDIHEAFETFRMRKDGALKVLIHPNGDI